MQLVFPCPKCGETERQEFDDSTKEIVCRQCQWARTIANTDIQDGCPQVCLVCGCNDLWKQKDFPPQLGLTMVGVGALLSTIAWLMYWPVLAIVILMGFAAIDLLLYWLMPDVLVCYRCDSRHRHMDAEIQHPRFNLETAERYRQEAKRMEQAAQTPP
ncbi:MAG: hypothetical protein Tsb009_34600 [Planctomycetaceae bacterium]